MALPRQSPAWDEGRNTSATRPPPGTAKQALEATARFRAASPRHAAWIAAGAPSITSEADHVRWFGEPYAGHGRRRGRR